MSALVGILNEGHVQMGQNGRKHQWGAAAFTTTGTTVAIPTNMRQVEAVLILPAAQPASDEKIWYAGAAAGPELVDGTGTITISRAAAAVTSGLVFYFLIIGR
jgi:hypothetical protein